MRKVIGAGTAVAAALVLVLVLTARLPKYSGFLWLFFIFFLIDVCFWMWLVKHPLHQKKWCRSIIGIFHWLPGGLSIIAFTWSMVIPFSQWPVAFRSYLVSVIIMLFIMKLPPLTLWLVYLPVRGIRRIVRHLKGKPINPPVIWWFWFSMAESVVILAVMMAGMVVWQHQLQVRTVTIPLRDLPGRFDGYKIVQLSDIHLGSNTSRRFLKNMADSVMALKPDLVLFTGDMFNYRAEEGAGFQPVLKSINAPDGVFAVMGNHDYGDYVSWDNPEEKAANFEIALQWFQKIGWQLLMNQHRIIKRGTDSIVLIGAENWGATKRFQRKGDIVAATMGTEMAPFKILMTHDPSHWDSVISRKHPEIDLTLCGHTHGGQVGYRSASRSWGPSSWVYPQWLGLYSHPRSGGDQYLYVNAGIGTVGFSGRIGIKPEITLIILRKDGV